MSTTVPNVKHTKEHNYRTLFATEIRKTNTIPAHLNVSITQIWYYWLLMAQVVYGYPNNGQGLIYQKTLF